MRISRRKWLAQLAAFSLTGCALTSPSKSPSPASDPQLVLPTEAPPNERYFVLVFGSERWSRRPKYTHTWATVARTRQRADGYCCLVDEQTISWMPASLDIRPLCFRPELGRNLGLHETLKLMFSLEEDVYEWGPYELKPRGYNRFNIQKAFMESGKVGYQCIDTIGEGKDGSGCDCIHAITDMDPLFDRDGYPLSRFGVSASEYIVEQIQSRNAVLSPCPTHDEVRQQLGLCQYPIIRRSYRKRRFS